MTPKTFTFAMLLTPLVFALMGSREELADTWASGRRLLNRAIDTILAPWHWWQALGFLCWCQGATPDAFERATIARASTLTS